MLAAIAPGDDVAPGYSVKYDDAAAVYINGARVVKTDNLPEPVLYNTYSGIYGLKSCRVAVRPQYHYYAGLERKGRPAAIYLHPWEFDPGQPRCPAPLLKRVRHYMNLDRTLPRLEALLGQQRWGTMSEVLRERGEL